MMYLLQKMSCFRFQIDYSNCPWLVSIKLKKKSWKRIYFYNVNSRFKDKKTVVQ